MHKTLILLTLLFINISIYSETQKVLLLNSYHQGFLWTDEITQGIIDSFSEKNIELHIEYMDSKRQWDANYQLLLKEILKVKITKHNYDIIITSDDNAFNFSIENREILFPNKPIIFCGLNYINKEKMSEYSNITGINEKSNISKNIDLITSLHPEIKNISIITDNTTTGKKIQNNVKNLLPRYPDLNIELIFNVTGEELINRVENTDLDTIILFTLFFTDKEGTYYDNIIQDLSISSKVPIYGSWDFDLNKGIIGGYLIGGYKQGEKAAGLSLMILSGVKVDDIPIEYDTPINLIFDYDKLIQFKITPQKVKHGTIINRPESFYYRNKRLIWSVVSILFILVLVLLLVTNALIRSKRAELALINYKEHLEEIVQNRTEELTTSFENLKKTQDQLIESKKMAYLGSLVSGVAHEMNTPLGIGITAISHQISQAENLQKKVGNNILTKIDLDQFMNDLKGSLELSYSSLFKAANIVSTFKQVEVESQFDNLINLNLYDFISQIIEDEVPLNVKINFNCTKDLYVETYPEALIHIIKNLIGNSIQHGFKNTQGFIDLYVFKRNKKTEIIYHDSGIGILPEDMPKIFDPFFTTKRVKGNIGLGLNIVYNTVVNKLNGTIECLSLPDQGTTFTILF